VNATQLSRSPMLRAAALAAAMLVPMMAAAGEAPDDLAALVNSMPDADGDGKYTGPAPDVAQKAVDQILAGGKDTLAALIGMLKPDDVGEGYQDYKADYLLHAVATFVARPDAEEQRQTFCTTLGQFIGGGKPALVQSHLIEELKWIGAKESVAPISKALLKDRLHDQAVDALVAIKESAPLRAVLPRAKGRQRIAVVQALGTLRDDKAIRDILPDVSSPDPDLRLAAIAALASIGDAAAVDPLLKAAKTESLYQRSKTIEALLDLADRLAEAGQTKEATRICRTLLAETAEEEMHFRCGAIVGLAKAAGAEAMDDVLAAMSSENADYRAAGFRAAVAMRGEQATQGWVARMKGADPARRIAILELLSLRGDPAALPAILAAVSDPDEGVRVAAIRAAGPAGDQRAVAPLIAALTGKGAAESMAARRALLAIPGTEASQAIAKAIPAAAAPLKVLLLDLLAARAGRGHLDTILAATQDEDAKVRKAAAEALGKVAALEDLPKLSKLLVATDDSGLRRTAEKALIAACARIGDKRRCVAAIAPAIEGAKGDARVALYRVLASIGSRTAYQVLSAGLTDPDDAVKDAALRGLADWPDDAPAKTLLQVAKTTRNETHHVLALRGYVRMIEVRQNRPTAQKLSMCVGALEAARRPDAKRAVLGMLAKVADPKALEIAQAQLKDKDVTDEAALAIVQIARSIAGAYRDKAEAALQEVTLATNAKAVHDGAKAAMAEIEKFEDFITGWRLAGPYRGGSTKKVNPPEQPDTKKGRQVQWKLITAAGRQPGVVDLSKLLGGSNVSAYLKAQIIAPEEMEARLEIGSDDGCKAWLNGQVVLDKDVPRSLNINEDKVPVKLKKGRNDLLLQITQGGGGWEACCRVRAADGSKLEGLRYAAE